MNMNRRGFFGLLAGFAATATMDPERLLWVPGKKLISIPSPHPIIGPGFFHLGDIITVGGFFDQWGDLQRFVVTAAGASFAEIRFRYENPGNALVYALPTMNLYHSELRAALTARGVTKHIKSTSPRRIAATT